MSSERNCTCTDLSTATTGVVMMDGWSRDWSTPQELGVRSRWMALYLFQCVVLFGCNRK